MDIFISWSGPKSHAVASALHKWLPKIVNAFKPWLSSADIDRGTRWRSDIAGRLQDARAGIICLTPSNLHSDWILFEAGALSKQIENTFVCTLLIGLEPTDVKDPLAQFQATRLIKPDILELLRTLNNGLGDQKLSDSHIEEAFQVWWPRLEEILQKVPEDEAAATPRRSERDLLVEILGLVRNQKRGNQVVVSTNDAILDTARLLVPDLKRATVGSGTGGYSISLVTENGKEYSFSLPYSASLRSLKAGVVDELGKLIPPEIQTEEA